MTEKKRLFLGGLYDGVTEEDVKKRFGRFGNISSVDIRAKKDDKGNYIKTFAYIDIELSDKEYKQCLQIYNKTRWKGNEVYIQVAKESFVDRLKREQEATVEEEAAAKVKVSQEAEADPGQGHREVRNMVVKGAVPGTEIEGKQNWVVGKYGRVLPVVNIRRKDNQKVITVDPSKYCDSVKNLNKDATENVKVANLTWQIEEEKDKEKIKKRTGDFHSVNGKRRKKMAESSDDEHSSTDEKEKAKTQKKSTQKKKEKLGSESEEDDEENRSKKKKINKDAIQAKYEKKIQKYMKLMEMAKKAKDSSSDSDSSDSESSDSDSKSKNPPPIKKAKMMENKAKKVVEDDFEVVRVGTGLRSKAKLGRSRFDSSSDSDDTAHILESKKAKTDQSTPKVTNKQSASSQSSKEASRPIKMPNGAVFNPSEESSDEEYGQQNRPGNVAMKASDGDSSDSETAGELLERVRSNMSSHKLDSNTAPSAVKVKAALKSNLKDMMGKKDTNSSSEDSASSMDESESRDSEENNEHTTSKSRNKDNKNQNSRVKKKVDSSSSSSSGSDSESTDPESVDSHHAEKEVLAKESDSKKQIIKDRVKKNVDSSSSSSSGSDSENTDSESTDSESVDSQHAKKEVLSKESDFKKQNTKDRVKKKVESSSSDEDSTKGHVLSNSKCQNLQNIKDKAKDKVETSSSSGSDDDSDSVSSDASEQKVSELKVEDNDENSIEIVSNPKIGMLTKENLLKKGKMDKNESGDSDSSTNTDELLSARRKKTSPEKRDTLLKSEALKDTEIIKTKPDLMLKSGGIFNEFSSGFEEVSSINVTREESEDSEEEDLLDLVASGKLKKLHIMAKNKEAKVTEKETISNNFSTKKSVEKDKAYDFKKDLPKKFKEKKAAMENKEVKIVDDNEKRLQSVLQRKKDIADQQSLIKKALASVDNKPSKRIVFDSDDEEDLTPAAPSVTSVVNRGKSLSQSKDGESSSKEDEEESGSEDEERGKTNKEEEKKPSLFEESDEEDEEDEKEDEERFRLRPQFEGKAGAKLMKLQSRFRNDERFRLDERFVDSGSEDEDGDSDMDVDTHQGAASERDKTMEILKQVVGMKAVKPGKEKKATFKDTARLQYDPTREDHEQFEVKPVESDKPKKKRRQKKEEERREEEEAEKLPEVSKERYFQVENNLKDVFQPSTDSTFSFSALFGGGSKEKDEEDLQDSEEEDMQVEVSKPAPSMNKIPWQQESEHDSSDEEAMREDAKRGDNSGEEALVTTANSKTIKKQTFFFTESDPRIMESVKSFCRTEDMDTIRKKWEEKRPDLVESYRNKRKNALRRGKSVGRGGTGGRGGFRGGRGGFRGSRGGFRGRRY